MTGKPNGLFLGPILPIAILAQPCALATANLGQAARIERNDIRRMHESHHRSSFSLPTNNDAITMTRFSNFTRVRR